MQTDPFIKMLIQFLITPSSDFYVSKLIAGATDPRLEPYATPLIDIGTQTIAGVAMDFKIQNLSISRISSIQVQRKDGIPIISVEGSNASFAAQSPNTEAPPPGIPGQLTLTGMLLITPETTPPIIGDVTVTIDKSTLAVDFAATSPDGTPNTITIDITKMAFDAGTADNNVSVSVKIASSLAPFINAALKKTVILDRIISEVRGQLGQESVRKAVSQYATQAARSALE